ncbi:MAG: radical SAM family heme chaperone HemW, partial [Bacteroidetes bacterium]|nr:radical SAM family heme chaperone HemW [Bacteroidota bacterium]
MSFGIYIHVPFCRRRCVYCDFYLTTNTNLIDDFVKSLCSEIALFAAETEDKHADTVFFGGGTPGLLGKKHLSDIFESLYRNFNIADGAEISLECNPEDISDDESKLKDFSSAGINRLSIGVQSFHGDELKFLTREHTARDSRESVIKAKKYFKNVSADIIYSLPGQTKEKLLLNLKEAEDLRIPHVSAYTLIFEKGTLLYRDMSNNKVKQNPDTVESELYHTANDYLRSLGYNHYEVSNYARKDFES